jgi:hypothetical protein
VCVCVCVCVCDTGKTCSAAAAPQRQEIIQDFQPRLREPHFRCEYKIVPHHVCRVCVFCNCYVRQEPLAETRHCSWSGSVGIWVSAACAGRGCHLAGGCFLLPLRICSGTYFGGFATLLCNKASPGNICCVLQARLVIFHVLSAISSRGAESILPAPLCRFWI